MEVTAADSKGAVIAKASLAEMMGTFGASSNGQMSLGDLPNILGDMMPELPRTAVGRHRLIRALQQRFGKNFRSLPGVQGLVTEFDADVSHEDKMRQIREIKYERKK